MSTKTVTTISMPQLGESVVEGTVGNWLKEIGDRIEKYDSLVEVETDKANAELPAPVSGILIEILIEPGTTVAVGTDICRIEEADATDARSDPTADFGNAEPGNNGVTHQTEIVASTSVMRRRSGEISDDATLLRTRSSPVVRRIAEEHGIEIGQVEGTGAGGRVTKRDIEHFVTGLSTDSGPTTQGVSSASDSIFRHRPANVWPGDEVIPISAMRRTIAEHMVRSERTAPHATVVMEVDMTGVVAVREGNKEAFRRRESVDLTYLPFVIKGVTLALADHPRLNAVWDEDRIIHRAAINIGVAVALEDGLVVPVVRNANRLSVTGLVHAVADLATKARAGSFAPDELSGGTFTVNNPGTFGSLVSTPIIVQPQVAILSTEAIIKRPVVIGDMIGIRSMMNLSLSIDHRALDGLAAARFLQQIKIWLESITPDFQLH